MSSQFIVLEGVTSTGKTTQGKMIVDRLVAKGFEAFFNHEPTILNPYGRIARRIVERNEPDAQDVAKAEVLGFTKKFKKLQGILSKIKSGKELTEIDRQVLYIADRHEDLRETIVPKLARGATCVQDRYELSTYAFAATKNIPYTRLKKLHSFMLQDMYVVPDILLYFDLDPKISADRLSKASDKPVDIYETLSKIRKTRSTYINLLKNKNLYKKLYIINAEAPLLEVFTEICLKLNI
ncbi:MAG: hypothetical protein Q8L47_05385 [bacterium]|nr:hypothetical protein [bacterium]